MSLCLLVESGVGVGWDGEVSESVDVSGGFYNYIITGLISTVGWS